MTMMTSRGSSKTANGFTAEKRDQPRQLSSRQLAFYSGLSIALIEAMPPDQRKLLTIRFT